jgi:hypothetical protein
MLLHLIGKNEKGGITFRATARPKASSLAGFRRGWMLAGLGWGVPAAAAACLLPDVQRPCVHCCWQPSAVSLPAQHYCQLKQAQLSRAAGQPKPPALLSSASPTDRRPQEPCQAQGGAGGSHLQRPHRQVGERGGRISSSGARAARPTQPAVWHWACQCRGRAAGASPQPPKPWLGVPSPLRLLLYCRSAQLVPPLRAFHPQRVPQGPRLRGAGRGHWCALCRCVTILCCGVGSAPPAGHPLSSIPTVPCRRP